MCGSSPDKVEIIEPPADSVKGGESYCGWFSRYILNIHYVNYVQS